MIVDFPDPLAPTTAVNFPAGIRSEICFSTITAIRPKNQENTFRTRRVNERDVLEFDFSLKIFWSLSLVR